MRTTSLEKRTLADLGYPVAAGVLRAIRLLEERYGASDYGSMPFPVEIDSTTNRVIGGTTPRS